MAYEPVLELENAVVADVSDAVLSIYNRNSEIRYI
jgi:hypothetical protein